jgi:two-component system sensor histidine kinase VicK
MNSTQTSKLDIILNAIQTGILIFDHNQELIHSNAGAEAILSRICPEEIILSITDITSIFNLTWKDEQGKIERDEIHKNGLSVSIVKQDIIIDNTITTLIQISDITGQKNQIATVYKQASDLLWKIRSRITPLQNALSLLTDYKDSLDTETTVELLKNSRFEIWQLERYMDTFRDMSLISANYLNQSLVIERLELDSLLDEALKNVKIFRNYAGIDCTIQHSTRNKYFINGDKMRITRIIESVLLNAMIYSQQSANIVITALKENNTVILKISDNGIGIPEADQSNIFTYGFRGENANKTEYNGMGCELFIARQIMLYNKGTISFQSRETQGATFELQFEDSE